VQVAGRGYGHYVDFVPGQFSHRHIIEFDEGGRKCIDTDRGFRRGQRGLSLGEAVLLVGATTAVAAVVAVVYFALLAPNAIELKRQREGARSHVDGSPVESEPSGWKTSSIISVVGWAAFAVKLLCDYVVLSISMGRVDNRLYADVLRARPLSTLKAYRRSILRGGDPSDRIGRDAPPVASSGWEVVNPVLGTGTVRVSHLLAGAPATDIVVNANTTMCELRCRIAEVFPVRPRAQRLSFGGGTGELAAEIAPFAPIWVAGIRAGAELCLHAAAEPMSGGGVEYPRWTDDIR
jgi:hypothetical protein